MADVDVFDTESISIEETVALDRTVEREMTEVDLLRERVPTFFRDTQVVVYDGPVVTEANIIGYARFSECLICLGVVLNRTESKYVHLRRHYLGERKGTEPTL